MIQRAALAVRVAMMIIGVLMISTDVLIPDVGIKPSNKRIIVVNLRVSLLGELISQALGHVIQSSAVCTTGRLRAMEDQDTQTQRVRVECMHADGIGVFTEDAAGMSEFHGMEHSVLWTDELLNCIVSVVISKQGAVMWHYPTSSSTTKTDESYEHLAQEALTSIRETWEDEDAAIKERF